MTELARLPISSKNPSAKDARDMPESKCSRRKPVGYESGSVRTVEAARPSKGVQDVDRVQAPSSPSRRATQSSLSSSAFKSLHDGSGDKAKVASTSSILAASRVAPGLLAGPLSSLAHRGGQGGPLSRPTDGTFGKHESTSFPPLAHAAISALLQ